MLQIPYDSMSDLDKKLYIYFWTYEEWEEEIKIVEPTILDLCIHFTQSKFCVFNTTFSTSVDWWTEWSIELKENFIPEQSVHIKYNHRRTVLEQSEETKKQIISIAECYLLYWNNLK